MRKVHIRSNFDSVGVHGNGHRGIAAAGDLGRRRLDKRRHFDKDRPVGAEVQHGLGGIVVVADVVDKGIKSAACSCKGNGERLCFADAVSAVTVMP